MLVQQRLVLAEASNLLAADAASALPLAVVIPSRCVVTVLPPDLALLRAGALQPRRHWGDPAGQLQQLLLNSVLLFLCCWQLFPQIMPQAASRCCVYGQQLHVESWLLLPLLLLLRGCALADMCCSVSECCCCLPGAGMVCQHGA